jgi:hypothetical protein
MRGAAEHLDDPVLEVAGVSAAEILSRCSDLRREPRGAARRKPRRSDAGVSKSDWRLLDFADLSDEDFVQAAHRILLGRRSSPFELDRRLGEMRAGSSRMRILVRLALSPEGRRAARPRVRGVGLQSLFTAAGAIEAASSNRALGPAIRRAEAGARRLLSRRSPRR